MRGFFRLRWYFLLLIWIIVGLVMFWQAGFIHECGFLRPCTFWFYLFAYWAWLIAPLLLLYTIIKIIIYLKERN